MRFHRAPSTAALVSVAFSCASAFSQSSTSSPHGTLATTEGCPIYDFELASLIATHIPACTKKLLVFTECYGGDKINDFANSPNTAVISATKPGQTAQYGGYHDDAARALKPGPGRNGNDVHVAGRNGRGKGETPTRGGTMSAGNFNLDNVTDNGPVRSRHIVVYAGIPNAMDSADRNAIKNNFQGEPNTTVHTAGAHGAANGYDQPGSSGGLHRAIDDAATEITNSPDPCREQFILFVTDHGDLEKLTNDEVRLIQSGQTIRTTIVGFRSGLEANGSDFLNTSGNTTSYSVILPLGAVGMTWRETNGRMFPNGTLTLKVQAGGYAAYITAFRELHSDFDNSGIIGDFPMDSILIEFDISEDIFVSSFFDNTITAAFTNRSRYTLPLGLQGLHSGEMMRGEYQAPCIADFDANGVVEDVDYDSYFTAFLEAFPDADLDGSGDVNAIDLAMFIEHFSEGC